MRRKKSRIRRLLQRYYAIKRDMVGLYLLHDLGLATLSINAAIPGAVIIVTLIFGLCRGLLGYRPSTSG